MNRPNPAAPTTGDVIGTEEDRVELGEPLGKGAQGWVYLGYLEPTNKEVAVKIPKKQKDGETEAEVYSRLNSRKYGEEVTFYRRRNSKGKLVFAFAGIPYIWFEIQHNGYHALVMDNVGPSLHQLLKQLGRRTFHLKDVLLIGIQCVTILENLHKKNCVHCDIKPANLLLKMKPNQKHEVHIADFGLAKKYIGKLRKPVESLVGTLPFASANAHHFTQSRRDDMESLGYTLLYLRQGTLPWSSIEQGNRPEKERYNEICNMKATITEQQYFEQGCPQELVEYIMHCRKLRTVTEPNYEAIRDFFTQCLKDRRWDSKFTFRQ